MKKPETNANETKAREFMKVDTFQVTRANCVGSKNTVFADLVINGVSIYGVTVVEGKNGDFLSFPQRKADNGKYYHIAYAPLSNDDQADIIKEIERVLNSK